MNFKQLSKTLIISLGAMVLAFSGTGLAIAGKIDVKMKNNGYEIHSAGSSGTMTPGFSLAAGEENVITLKNEDTTAHDFVSKAFTGMDVVVVGEAEEITDGMASGYRVAAGKSVMFKLTPRVGPDFSGSWDVFTAQFTARPT